MIKNITQLSSLEIFDLLIKAMLLISPVFLMTTKGWTNGLLFLLFTLTTISLIRFKSLIPKSFDQSQKISVKIIIASLAAGFLMIFITQGLRGELILKAFDAPLRMLLCIPIFLYLCHKPLNIAKAAPYVFSLSFLATFIYLLQHPDVPALWGGRFATKPVDPNAFGVYSTLILSLLLFSINLNNPLNQKLRLCITFLGLALGTYLVIGSGTRGAWLAIPFLLMVWAAINVKNNLKLTLLLSGFFFVTTWIGYAVNSNFQTRVDLGFHEIYSWLFTTAKDTSAGIRLSMWQVTWELLHKNPFLGFGDSGYQHLLNNQNLTGNYSPIVLDTIAKAGPHNEYIANLLRSGIFGGLGITATLFAPFYVYLQSLFRSQGTDIRSFNSGHLGLGLFICLAISSMSIEIFNLKYTSSFYGLLIAMIYSKTIAEKSSNT
jgi:O-antigen ligase